MIIIIKKKNASVAIQKNTKSKRKYLKIIAQDSGPGIQDLDLVLAGGHSTSKGLGLGISGSKRIMDEFTIQSEADKGTIITAVKWLS